MPMRSQRISGDLDKGENSGLRLPEGSSWWSHRMTDEWQLLRTSLSPPHRPHSPGEPARTAGPPASLPPPTMTTHCKDHTQHTPILTAVI